MSEHLVCSCGADVTFDEGVHQLTCPTCGASLERPEPSGDPVEPLRAEEVFTEKGPCWKITCPCNKRILVPQAANATIGRCPKCGQRIHIPSKAESSTTAPESGKGEQDPPLVSDEELSDLILDVPEARDPFSPPEEEGARVRVEEVSTEKGPCWKITCSCNKRILVSREANSPLGRCPKCGRRIHIPGQAEKIARPDKVGLHKPLVSTGELSDLVSDLPVSAPPAAAAEPEPPHPRFEEPASRAAALRTADILRSKKLSDRSDGGSLISAWPLAGHLPRALAGFIDLTLGLVAAMLIVIGGSLEVLPENSRYWVVPVVAFYTAVLLNDCLLQLFGGSIGKRMVVLTLRAPDGRAPSVAVVLLRAIFKWLLLPGWLLAFVHPTQRALHDLLCNTCVLKGRVRHG